MEGRLVSGLCEMPYTGSWRQAAHPFMSRLVQAGRPLAEVSAVAAGHCHSAPRSRPIPYCAKSAVRSVILSR